MHELSLTRIQNSNIGSNSSFDNVFCVVESGTCEPFGSLVDFQIVIDNLKNLCIWRASDKKSTSV